MQITYSPALSEDKDAVFKYADEALMFLPQHLELHFYKGLSLYMLGNKKESISALFLNYNT